MPLRQITPSHHQPHVWRTAIADPADGPPRPHHHAPHRTSTRQMFNYALPPSPPRGHIPAGNCFAAPLLTEQELALKMPWTPAAAQAMNRLPVIRTEKDQIQLVKDAFNKARRHAKPGRANVIQFGENHDNLNMLGLLKNAIRCARSPEMRDLKIGTFLIELEPRDKNLMARTLQKMMGEISRTPGGADEYFRSIGCTRSLSKITLTKMAELLRFAATNHFRIGFIDIESEDIEERNRAMNDSIRKYTKGGHGAMVLNGLRHLPAMQNMLLRGQTEPDGPRHVVPRVNAISIAVLDSSYPQLTAEVFREYATDPVGSRYIPVRVATNMKFKVK